jgi:hypothetical protein
MKREYLVLYDYGMGGVWAYLTAESEHQIRERFPQLRVVTETPSWWTTEVEARTRDGMTMDIDDESHPFLAALRKGQEASGTL